MTATAKYELAPLTVRKALRWVEATHRHLPELQGGLFAVGVKRGADYVGGAIAGHPARVWMDTGRIIITRVAAIADLPAVVGSDGEEYPAPVCTMLYGALCRAATPLGYSEAWTYTLSDEDGRSVRHAGFLYMGVTKDEATHARPSRFRQDAVCPGRKHRWCRPLTPAARRRILAEIEDKKIPSRPDHERLAA